MILKRDKHFWVLSCNKASKLWLGLHLARTVLHRDITEEAFSLLAQISTVLENILLHYFIISEKSEEYNRVQIP